MKKLQSLLISFIVVISFSTSVVACPLWSCQYDVSDYSCGCSCDSNYDSSYDYNCNYTSDYSYNEDDSCSYDYNDYNEYNVYNEYNTYNTYNTYNEYNVYNEYNDCSSYVETYNYDSSCTYNQPQYCQYCGNEAWACTCYNDCYYEDSSSYSNYSSCSYYDSIESMDHWANIRDCYGNVVGQVGAGSSVEVIGVDCSDSDRVMIYDYASGTYGSVLSDCVYGGYQWDGTGCNGYYNSYHGSSYNCVSNDYYDANYSYGSCDYGVTNCSYYDSYDYCDYYDSYDYCDSYDSCDSCGSYNYNCSYGYNYNYCNPNIEYVEIIGIIRHVNSCMRNNVCSSRRSNIVPKC